MVQQAEVASSVRPAVPAVRTHIRMLATVLLLLDVLYLLGNITHLASNDPDESPTVFSAVQWDGNYDGSYIELFGHTQLIGGAVMLVFLAVIRRSFSLAVWTAVLVVLVLDDFLLIHERMGATLVTRMDLPSVAGLRPQDLGEMLVWGALGGVLGGALLIAYIMSSDIDRRDSRVLFGWLALLGIFAAGVDMLHIIADPHVGHLVSLALVLLETSGELVGMTLIVLAIHRMFLRTTLVVH